MSRPDGRDPAAVVRHFERLLGVIGSPAYPPDPNRLRERLQAMVARAYRPAGTARQIMAVMADGDRSALLPRIVAPTRIIHGAADPLVPVACGLDLAARITGAEADILPGMGHDLPLPLLARIAEGVAGTAARAVPPPA
jgi:pimeloyl-ACP methyl ester carboxylesterase